MIVLALMNSFTSKSFKVLPFYYVMGYMLCSGDRDENKTVSVLEAPYPGKGKHSNYMIRVQEVFLFKIYLWKLENLHDVEEC